MIKKSLLGLNALFLVLSLITVLKGVDTALIYAIFYALSLGSLIGQQKQFYHITCFVANIAMFLSGVFMVGYLVFGKSALIDAKGYLILIPLLFFALIIVPFLNILFIKTKINFK